MKIAMIGAGYVGLVTAACLAEAGHDVMCFDSDREKIVQLQGGVTLFFEAGLASLILKNSLDSRLHFTHEAQQAMTFGPVIFIAVNTPATRNGSPDLTNIFRAAHHIGELACPSTLVVVKSTVPVGTCEKIHAVIVDQLLMRGLAPHCEVASNPEFLREGSAIDDFLHPDRIVIGVTKGAGAQQVLRELYSPFVTDDQQLVTMDIRSAELSKYAANVMLATRISLMNELANLADACGADIEQVRQAIGADQRIGPDYLRAGTGYGGSCFPKDVKALRHQAQSLQIPSRILSAVDETNTAQKQVLVQKLIDHHGEDLRGMSFALWGLSFKPDTDDMREAPSRAIMERLWEAGASVRAYDPAAMPAARQIYGQRDDLALFDCPMEAITGASALLIATEWQEFLSPDFAMMKRLLSAPLIFDGRNLYDPDIMGSMGFLYFSVGRPTAPLVPPVHASRTQAIGLEGVTDAALSTAQNVTSDSTLP
ncbi:MAG: UDP-glucose/GDP-mannose dehydrogenase family protein [Telluria sp.]